MAAFKVNDKVTIPGVVTEVVENEAQGTRIKVKVKANDALHYLVFEDDEITSGSSSATTEPETDPEP